MNENILVMELDGIGLNDPANGFTLPEESIIGLYGLPELRTETGNNFGTDGGWINPPKYAPRKISFSGMISSRDIAEVEAKRNQLNTMLAQSHAGKDLTLRVVTYAGFERFITVRLLRCTMPTVSNKNKQPYDMDLYAPDPNYYDSEVGSLMAIIGKTVEGGFEIPFEIPLPIDPSSPTPIITNTGNTISKPYIKITTPATNPQLTNKATGAIMKINTVVSDGDTLIIDMKKNQILKNGDNIFYLKTDYSTFWGLAPGDNPIDLVTDIGSEPTQAEFYYNSAFIQI